VLYSTASLMKLLTTAEAADQLGITSRRVRQLIADGRIAAKKVGRDYVIDPRSLKAVEDRKTGRPAKGKAK
jgi:excisionase family DNA binding protein